MASECSRVRGADGEITINSGAIFAIGGNGEEEGAHGGGAGIGSGYNCHSPEIRINGGMVTAFGGKNAAGIGGAGIGGGWFGFYWPITITGGEVYAYGTLGSAGIGLRQFPTEYTGQVASKFGGGQISILGGKVTAVSSFRNDRNYTYEENPSSIKNGAGAFVYGDHNSQFIFRSSLHLYEGAKTTYTRNYVSESDGGPEPSVVFSSGNTFTAEDIQNRVWILQNSYEVTIEPCDHAGATYLQNIVAPKIGQVMHCTTCNLPEDVEPHTYDSTGTCTLCGYYAGTCTVTFDPDN